MKHLRILGFAVLLFIFSALPHATSLHAQTTDGFTPLAPIPGLTEGKDVGTAAGLPGFLNQLYKYSIGIAAMIAVVEIIIGGLQISVQESIPEQQGGRKRIQQAILGLVLVLSPFLVFSIINPAILDLNIGLKNLDTSPTPATSNGPAPIDMGGAQDRTLDTSSACTIAGEDGLLRVTVCRSQAAAEAWVQHATDGLCSAVVATPPTYKVVCGRVTPFAFKNVTMNGNSVAEPLAQNNNAVLARRFGYICNSAGFKTCMDAAASSEGRFDCPPLTSDTSPTARFGCFNTKLSCVEQNSGGFGNCYDTHTGHDDKSTADWTPIQ